MYWACSCLVGTMMNTLPLPLFYSILGHTCVRNQYAMTSAMICLPCEGVMILINKRSLASALLLKKHRQSWSVTNASWKKCMKTVVCLLRAKVSKIVFTY